MRICSKYVENKKHLGESRRISENLGKQKLYEKLNKKL